MSRTFRARPADDVELFDTTTTGDLSLAKISTGDVFIGNSGGGEVTIRGSSYTGVTPYTIRMEDASGNEPVYAAGGQKGYYTRNQGYTLYSGTVIWTGKGSTTSGDGVRISLPFVPRNGSFYGSYGLVISTSTTTSDLLYIRSKFGGVQYADIKHTSPGVSDAFLLWSELDTSGQLSFTIEYMTP